MPRSGAIEQAMALMRMPTLAHAFREASLPADVSLLLRIVAGIAEAEQEAVRASGKPLEIVREAAGFYVVHILLDERSDNYRKLGCTPAASREQLRLHMALLLRWLHPDLNRKGAYGVLANRVMQAWGELKDPERRSLLDERLTRKKGGPAAGRAASARRGRTKSLHLIRIQRAPSATPRAPGKGSRHYWMAFLIICVAAALVLFGLARPDLAYNLRDSAQFETTILSKAPAYSSSVQSVNPAGVTSHKTMRDDE